MTKLNSFYQHSLEEDAAWTKSASEHIFFADIHVPLSAKMLKRALNTKLPRATVFHVTNAQYLDDIIKMQGKRKSLSAATQMHHTVVTGGINVRGGMVFELEADVMVSAPNDIMSRPDKTGRRWLEWYMLSTDGAPNGKAIKEAAEKFGQKEIVKLIEKYGGPKRVALFRAPDAWSKMDPRNTSSLYNVDPKTSKIVKDMSYAEIKILLRDMIKDYIDAMERMLTKFGPDLAKLFFAHAQNATKDVNDGWDEIVVNNYRIKSILLHDKTVMSGFSRNDFDVQEEHWEILIDKLDRLGIDYEIFEEPAHISREIKVRSMLDFI